MQNSKLVLGELTSWRESPARSSSRHYHLMMNHCIDDPTAAPAQPPEQPIPSLSAAAAATTRPPPRLCCRAGHCCCSSWDGLECPTITASHRRPRQLTPPPPSQAYPTAARLQPPAQPSPPPAGAAGAACDAGDAAAAASIPAPQHQPWLRWRLGWAAGAVGMSRNRHRLGWRLLQLFSRRSSGTICAKCAGIAKIFASKSFGLGKDYLIQQREQSRKIRVIRPHWQSLANVEYFVAVTAKCVLMKHRLQPRSLIRVDLAPEGRESMFA
jgi:hypothetical protein